MAFWNRTSKNHSEPVSAEINALKGKNIWLVRHAESDDMRGDHLTNFGEDSAWLRASALRRQGLSVPSIVIASARLRAQETARIIAGEELPVFVSEDYFRLSMRPEKYAEGGIDNELGRITLEACRALATIHDYQKSIVFVGHSEIMKQVRGAQMLSPHVEYAGAIPYELGMLTPTE